MKDTAKPAITLLIDGQCPLCTYEMLHLKQHDKLGVVELIDIHSDAFSQRFGDIGLADASARLHGLLPDGQWVYGLDATHQAWRAVGMGHLTAWLRFRGIRPLTDLGYRFFARHRERLGRLVPRRLRVDACDICRR